MNNNLKAIQILTANIPCTKEDILLAESLGMIPKKDLIHNLDYEGYCRNGTIGTWNADKQRFLVSTFGMGFYYKEETPHPEDDDGFDIFIPIKVKDI